MRKITLYIILLIVLATLILIYITMRYKNVENQNYYKLNSNIYLEKIDYFSEYAIVKKNGDVYTTFITNVEAIFVLEKGYLIKFKEKSATKFLYVDAWKDQYVINDRLKEFDDLIIPHELDWKKPWQIVEIITLGNPKKLISQILLIVIIALSFYIIMKTFKLKRLI